MYIYIMMENKKLSYYLFDFDDNILHMETKIHMETFIDGVWVSKTISTSEFSKIRNSDNWRVPNGNVNLAFVEFSDIGDRGDKAFLTDIKGALSKDKYGPSWDKFIECVTSGNIFGIITARAHESKTIRESIQYIIDTKLNDIQKVIMVENLRTYITMFDENKNKHSDDDIIQLYLDACDYYGVGSEGFKNTIKDKGSDASNPEQAKSEAVKMFTKRVHGFSEMVDGSIHIGFSDDDVNNVNTIEKLFKNELSLKFREINFNVYDTSNPNINDGIRIIIN